MLAPNSERKHPNFCAPMTQKISMGCPSGLDSGLDSFVTYVQSQSRAVGSVYSDTRGIWGRIWGKEAASAEATQTRWGRD